MSVIRHPKLRWLFIGSSADAKNIGFLKSNRIRYILNCSDNVPNYHQKDNLSFEYCRLPLSDNESERLDHHYQKCWEFFDRCLTREDGCLLVHCKLGISRSAACLMSFLIKFMRMSYSEALHLLETSRETVDPNTIFRQQLQQLSKQLENNPKEYGQFLFKDENESLLLSGRCFEAWSHRKLGPSRPLETSGMIADIVRSNAEGAPFVVEP